MQRGSAWRRRQFREAVLLEHGPICWLCLRDGKPAAIDLTLPPRHPMSYSADHVIPVSLGGPEFDPANGRPAHYTCNSSRKAKPVTEERRRWRNPSW